MTGGGSRGVGLLIAFAVGLLVVLGVLGLLAWGRAQTFTIAPLATRPPQRTAMMRQREREAGARGARLRIDRRWVPYSRIAPVLRRAVLVAEDDAFFAHGGLDWSEIRASARENWKQRRIARGGSTITQQLAKNLYLGDARTPTRKLTELFVALRLERQLSKRRIFELYLNSIEWGDGIFGIEAAAQRYFHVPASQLDARQSVLLASVIINPRRYSPVDPGRRISKRARMIAGRLKRRGYLDDEQYWIAIGVHAPDTTRRSFTDWFFGSHADTSPSPAPDEPPVGEPADSVPAPPAAPDTSVGKGRRDSHSSLRAGMPARVIVAGEEMMPRSG